VSTTAHILADIVALYELLILFRLIISWFPVRPNHLFLLYLYDLTEPALAPFRRLLPPIGFIDFSPILLFLILELLRNFLLGL